MATRSQKIRLGIFAIATALLLVGVLVIFAGLRFWEDEDSYQVEFTGSVLGLQVGSDVLLNGVRVGGVDSIEISPDDPAQVRIAIAVAEGTPIRTNTRAMLALRGITGLKIIDLREGTAAAPPLPPGSRIPAAKADLDKLLDRGEQIADRTLEVMDSAERALEGATRVSAQLEAMVDENRALVKGALTSVAGAAQRASRLMDGELRQVVAGASALVADVSGVVKQNQTQVRAALLDLRRASGNFKELSRELRQRPSGLLFSKPPADRRLP